MEPHAQPAPGRSTRLRRILDRVRSRGLLDTIAWAWCRKMPEMTGIPILADGRIAPSVYIGPQYGRAGKLLLRLAGIRHTISLRAEFNDAESGLTLGTHLHVPIEDEAAPTLEQLHEAVSSVHEAVERGDVVYIHCRQGRGRASTLAAAYLISRGNVLSDALAALHRARRSIDLTPIQLERLAEFAEAYAKVATDPESVTIKPAAAPAIG